MGDVRAWERDADSHDRGHFGYRSRSGSGPFEVRAVGGTGGLPSTGRARRLHPGLPRALRPCPHSRGSAKPRGSGRSAAGSWVALFSRELLGLFAGYLGFSAGDYRDLVRGGSEPDRGASPAANGPANPDRCRRGGADCRYRGLQFLLALAGSGGGAPVLDADQGAGRPVPLGGKARSAESGRPKRSPQAVEHGPFVPAMS